MTRKRTVGILAVVTAAAASIFALAQEGPATENATPPSATPGIAIVQPCAFTWAYKDLPDISANFESAVQAVLPEASAHATAFGEDCIAADGSASFSAIETDFYVIISVADINNEEMLGHLITQILPILDNFAIGSVPGSQEGFVEFTFQAGENQRVIRVPIPLGRELHEQNLQGADVIRALEAQ